MTPRLRNTIGEFERETRSRRANAIEALAVAACVMTVLWPICFGFGVLGENTAVQLWSQVPIGVFMLWALIGSPFWHRDSPQSLGLGNPVQLWQLVRERRPWVPTIVIGLFGTLLLVSIANWPDTARMFRLGSNARLWPLTPDGSVKMVCFSALVSAFVVVCVVRYDNLGSALRVALLVSASLVLYAGIAAVLHRGWQVFSVIDPARYPLDVIAYVFWGGLQQFVFTAYFSTRLRKAIPPAQHPSNVVPAQARLRWILLGGTMGALTIGPAIWIVVRMMHGPDLATIPMLLGFVSFALPIGAVWTHFFCRDKRRMIVATIAGSFFGVIHIDSYGLVLVTFGLGIVLAYVFMEDRFRNLSALALIHGFLASTFGKLFKGEAAGPLRVDYKVGPWNVDDPSNWMIIIPTLCAAGYIALLIWAWFDRRIIRNDTPVLSEAAPEREAKAAFV